MQDPRHQVERHRCRSTLYRSNVVAQNFELRIEVQHSLDRHDVYLVTEARLRMQESMRWMSKRGPFRYPTI